jgi:[citrate (pro-3S)-lyase] ligase
VGFPYGTVTTLHSASDLREAREFIVRSGLAFEEGCDDFAGAYENGRLVGAGARAGNVLKMLTVEPSRQGGPLLGQIVTTLVNLAFAAGCDSLFVFTKPEHSVTFEALNFSLLASQRRVALLEYGGGLERWLSSKRELVRPGRNGAVVANGNPFTLGHRYLIETAAGQVDHLYLFIVREDRSVFPFDVRYRLAREGVSGIPNVILLDTSHYAVSGATFPTYFLKKDDPVARIQMELDAALFASKIAPSFDIATRFVGTEPYCAMTGSYNEALKRILPVYGIGLCEVERKQDGGSAISASRVRELLAAGDLAAIGPLVPPATFAYLRGREAGPAVESLRRRAEPILR